MLGFFAKEHSPFEILSRSFLVGLLGMLPRASLEPNKTLMQLARRVSNKHHTDSDSATSSIPFFFSGGVRTGISKQLHYPFPILFSH